MSREKEFYPEVLPRASRQLLPIFPVFSFLKNFYLSGGTGLALQIAHRISRDFDFFTPQPVLNTRSRERILEAFQPHFPVQILLSQEGSLSLLVKQVRVSFFYYPFLCVEEPVCFQGLKIASVKDIALDKLSAIIGRGSKRDFLDVYWCLQVSPHPLTLPELLESARQKFRVVRDFQMQALRALVYFKDAEGEPMPRLLRSVRWNTVKDYFRHQVSTLSRIYLKS